MCFMFKINLQSWFILSCLSLKLWRVISTGERLSELSQWRAGDCEDAFWGGLVRRAGAERVKRVNSKLRRHQGSWFYSSLCVFIVLTGSLVYADTNVTKVHLLLQKSWSICFPFVMSQREKLTKLLPQEVQSHESFVNLYKCNIEIHICQILWIFYEYYILNLIIWLIWQGHCASL